MITVYNIDLWSSGRCAVDLFRKCTVKTLTLITTTIWIDKLASLFPHKSLRVRLQVASQPVAERASDQGVCCCATKEHPGLTQKATNNGFVASLNFQIAFSRTTAQWFHCQLNFEGNVVVAAWVEWDWGLVWNQDKGVCRKRKQKP